MSDVENIGFYLYVLDLIRGRVVGNAVVLENFIGNTKVLSELQGGLGVYVRDSVQSVSELAVDLSLSVHKLNGKSLVG